MRYDQRDKTDYSEREEQVFAHQDYRVMHRLPDGKKPVHPNLAPYHVIQVRHGQPSLHVADAGTDADAISALHIAARTGHVQDIVKQRWRNKVAKGLVCPNCSRKHPSGTEDQHPGLAFRCGGCGLKFIVTNPAVLD